LGEYLDNVNQEAACVMACHQHLVDKGEEGFVDSEGHCKLDQRGSFATMGKQLIEEYIQQ